MELLTTENGKYRLEYMSAATFPGALHVMRESFYKHEPVSVGTEVSRNPTAIEEMLGSVAYAAMDGVSLVAVEIETGEVAAAFFNTIEDHSDSSTKEFYKSYVRRCTQPETFALMQFFADFETNFFVEKSDVNCSFDIMFLGTLLEHRRNSLGLLLCKEAIKLAKSLKHGLQKELNVMSVEDLGPKYSFIPPRKPVTKIPEVIKGVFSSVASQKIAKALNFKVDLRVSYKEFSCNGKTFEERIGSGTFLEVCSLKID